MADALYAYARHIRGWANEMRLPGTPAQEIKPGDFLMMVTGTVQRISTQADLGTLAQNQAGAKAAFVGVAIDQKRAGDVRDVLVATRGVFRYPITALAAAHNVGEYVSAEGTGAGLAVGLADQQVQITTNQAGAFGRLSKAAAIGDVFVEVEIAGTLTTPYAGTQAAV